MSDVYDHSILLVDDESEITAIVELEAKKLFKEVYIANHPSDAVALSKKHKIDVSIVDMNMPDMSGLELVAKLRENNPRTACIILSAEDTKENIQDALRLGVCDFIEKPFTRIYLKLAMLRGVEKHLYDTMLYDMLDLFTGMEYLKKEDLKDLSSPTQKIMALKKGFKQIQEDLKLIKRK